MKLWIAIPTAIVVGILNVFIFFLFMVLYGHVIAPGHPDEYYQEAAGRFGPYASIIAGIPLMYLAGRWIGKRVGQGSAITAGFVVWFTYFVLDLAIIVAAGGALLSFAVVIIISFSSKLAAVYLGAKHSIGEASPH